MNSAKIINGIFLISLISATIFCDDALKSKHTTIVTVSLQKVMMESETGKAIQESLQAEQQKLAAPLQAKAEALQAKQDKIMTQEKDGKLDRETLEFEKRQLGLEMQKIQAEGQKIEAKLYEMQQKEMVKFQELVTQTISSLAATHGWDIVLAEEQSVYVNPALSKTKIVIAELDKRAKAAKLAKKEALEKEAKAKSDNSSKN